MLNNAKSTITSANDAQTRDVVVENITNEDYTFILADFSGMLAAGKNGGFKADNAAYISALTSIDGYIGEFLTAIDARENIYYEDWLVILTSNHGGTADGHFGGASDAERNNFGLFYYNHYDEEALNGSKLYGALFDTKNQYKALAFDSIGAYSLGTDAFAVEVIMCNIPKQDGTYTNGGDWNKMIGKKGWGIFRQRTEASFYISSSPAFQQNPTAYNDAQWHHYGFSVASASTGNRDWRITLDGVLKASGTTTSQGVSLDSTFLQIGGTSVKTSYLVSEVRLWKKNLAERDFQQETDIAPSNDMLAYWKFKPSELVGALGSDTLIIRNQIQGGFNLYYIKNADAEWPAEGNACAMYANTLPTYINAGKICVENTLIVPQILYWLGISAPSSLDGYQFINLYSLSEEWREDPNAE